MVGEIKEVRKIFKSQYDEGSTVIKTEEVVKESLNITSDIMITNIRNIPPKKELTITFSFIQK